MERLERSLGIRNIPTDRNPTAEDPVLPGVSPPLYQVARDDLRVSDLDHNQCLQMRGMPLVFIHPGAPELAHAHE